MTIVPCPYKSMPDHAYWRKSVGGVAASDIDPVVAPKFFIEKDDKIATAGSCFAQHISRYMSNSGYNYYIPENGHEIFSQEVRKEFNYGTFSCRYGNLYTTRQLLQLVKRAYGEFSPEEDVWKGAKGFVDPYRPFIQPNGFRTIEEFHADRQAHYAAVREMVENFDVFVFTLGLTEVWLSAADGSAFPVCPGCGAGEHDPEKHIFHNLTVDEVVADMNEFIAFAKDKNPNGKVLLTVSPVPLIATALPKHVLVSTTYSKSVLRVAAQMLADGHDHVDYFPSYEIITGNFSGGRYYETDLREVREEGVNHAMRCFFRNYVGVEVEKIAHMAEGTSSAPADSLPANSKSELLAEIICDEEQMADNF